MLRREEQEEYEVKMLAGYAMKSRYTKGRKYKEEEHLYRTAFQRDRDRIIHSSAFRRLEYKTQVFLTHEGDYYRTRLTHTMEVAQISRTIARALRLNEDLSECIALAHDLGHPPFGHAGEEALKELMKDAGGFEHNLQSLRIVEYLENRYPDFPGLNLTFELRESLRKHPTSNQSPIEKEYEPELSMLLEAKIVDFADSIAYISHDIDDGLKSKILLEKDLLKNSLWSKADKFLAGKYDCLDENISRYQKVVYIINSQVTDLIKQTEKNIQELGIRSVEDVRNCKKAIVRFSNEMRKERDEIFDFLMNHLYKHYRQIRMAEKSKRFVVELFNAYLGNIQQLPVDIQKEIENTGDKKKAICDYIAGMTDRFAQEEYKKLFYPFERT